MLRTAKARSRPPSQLHKLSESDLSRIAYSLLLRYWPTPAVRLTVRNLAEGGEVAPRLQKAARTLDLLHHYTPPDIGEPLTETALWQWRDESLKAGERIGFEFAEDGSAAPVLRGTVANLEGGRHAVILAALPKLRDEYAAALRRAGVRVERRETQGVTLEQAWVEASGEFTPDKRTHGGRAPLRRANYWQFTEYDLPTGESIPTWRRVDQLLRRRDVLLAVLIELAELLAARRIKAAERRAAAASNDRSPFQSPAERKAWEQSIRERYPVPPKEAAVAAILRDWAVYDRMDQERGRKALPGWPGYRATVRRLRRGCSKRDLHDMILTLHNTLTDR